MWHEANFFGTKRNQCLQIKKKGSVSKMNGRTHEQTTETPLSPVRLAKIWESDSSLCYKDLRKRPCASCYLVTKSYPTPGPVARQAPLSMEFSRQEHQSGLPCPSPEDLSDPRIEPGSPALQAGSLPRSHQGRPHTLLMGMQTGTVVGGNVTKFTKNKE